MFGYVTVYEKELKIRDYETYRSYYCGLCSALKKQYGRTGQMLLNYDMTFLLMLLSGLYEPEERSWEGRCAPHPARRHAYTANRFTQYAADMTVLLAWEKAKDDWTDEKNWYKANPSLGATISLESTTVIGIVKINREIIRETEHDTTQRVAYSTLLTNTQFTRK